MLWVMVNFSRWPLNKKSCGGVLMSRFLGMKSWKEKRQFKTVYMMEYRGVPIHFVDIQGNRKAGYVNVMAFRNINDLKRYIYLIVTSQDGGNLEHYTCVVNGNLGQANGVREEVVEGEYVDGTVLVDDIDDGEDEDAVSDVALLGDQISDSELDELTALLNELSIADEGGAEAGAEVDLDGVGDEGDGVAAPPILITYTDELHILEEAIEQVQTQYEIFASNVVNLYCRFAAGHD